MDEAVLTNRFEIVHGEVATDVSGESGVVEQRVADGGTGEGVVETTDTVVAVTIGNPGKHAKSDLVGDVEGFAGVQLEVMTVIGEVIEVLEAKVDDVANRLGELEAKLSRVAARFRVDEVGAANAQGAGADCGGNEGIEVQLIEAWQSAGGVDVPDAGVDIEFVVNGVVDIKSCPGSVVAVFMTAEDVGGFVAEGNGTGDRTDWCLADWRFAGWLATEGGDRCDRKSGAQDSFELVFHKVLA